jgi:hypothetical protein
MADFTLSWSIAGSANNGLQTVQYRHYGDTTWTTYSTEAVGVITKTIIGLDDNKVYEFRVVNNCTTGQTNPSNILQQVVKVCPVFKELVSANCGEISFNFQEPNPASPDIVDYTVNLYQLGNPTPIASYFALASHVPGASISHTFTNLTGNTTYQVNIVMNIQGSVLYTINCPKQNITTIAAEPCDPIIELTAELGPGLRPGDVDLTLNWTPPSPVPANGYIVYYRRVGTSVYSQIVVSNTQSNLVISSITPGYDYEGYIVCVCDPCCNLPGCQNLSVQVPFQTVSYNIKVVNSQNAGLEIASVLTTTGVPPLTGNVAGINYANTVTYGQTVTGSHLGFTDTFDFEIIGTIPFASRITILKNGGLIECITIPAGTYTTFAPLVISSTIVTAYLLTDQIMIVAENLACNILP